MVRSGLKYADGESMVWVVSEVLGDGRVKSVCDIEAVSIHAVTKSAACLPYVESVAGGAAKQVDDVRRAASEVSTNVVAGFSDVDPFSVGD